MDHSAFSESVKKTGRAVVVHEAPRSFGAAAEVTARLVEKSFLYLEAPIKRVTGFDVHIPLFQKEKIYLPGVARIVKAARQTLNF
jgi:pyruvate dehydrogenase E1 component beta subunit